MIKEVSAGAICYKNDNGTVKYLVVQHVNNGHYSFPKGHVEKNESFIDTAIREVYEETGIEIEINDNKMEINTYLMPNGIYKDVFYFLAQAKSNKIIIQKEELDQALWMEKSEVINTLTYQNDKVIFVKLTKDLN